MSKRFSQFTSQNTVSDNDYINITGATNRRIVWPDFLDNIYDRIVTPFIYPTIVSLKEAPLRADEDDPVYVRVEETEYRLYKITNIAPGASDIVLDNGNTATAQTEYRDIGFVVGPDVSEVGALATYDNTTGTLLANGPTPSAVGVNLIEFPDSSTDGYFRKKNDNTLELLTGDQLKTNLSLNNVDNTSDAQKVAAGPIFDALALKAPLASPALTGTPTAPTAAAGTNTAQIANTAFVQGELTDRIQSVATIADLEALDSVVVGQHFTVSGYISGTLGGGDFVAISGSAARDGVKTFVAANGVRIQRTNIETVTPYHAGWNGTDDAHTYVQACLDAYNDVYCPAEVYTVLFDSVKIQRDGVVLRGDGETTVFINKAGQEIGVAGGVVKIDGTELSPITGSKIQNINVDYNRDNVTHSIDPRDNECISVKYGDGCEVTGCTTVNGIYEGIDIDHTVDSLISNNESHDNNGHGIHVSSGSLRNMIAGNRCSNNGWVAFRSGMDCYEGFDLGGPNEIPQSENNIYIGNDCWDNYINYRILGPGNVFDANRDHGTTGAGSNLSGVIGGVRAITASAGERAKNIWQANTGNDELASFAEIVNPDGNARFKLCYRKSTSGVESFIIASNTNNVLFEIFAGSGYATFPAQWTPESGAFGSVTYQNATGYYVRTGKQVSFNLRLSMSQLTLDTASGKIQITGLPVSPQVAAPVAVSSVFNWDFAAPPAAINGRVTGVGAIELEYFTPNATSQTFVSADDLKTGSGSFLNQVYISGSFVTA